MDIWRIFFNWFENLITDVGGISKFLNFSIEINGYNLNIFSILTITGLLIYLAVAVIKWIIS